MHEVIVGKIIITYDSEAEAYYLYLRPESKGVPGVAKRTHQIELKGPVLVAVDVDSDDHIVGIEIIDTRR